MRIFATCLGFNTPEMVRGALQNFEDTTFDFEHRRMVKTLFYCDFPLPDQETNRRELHKIGAEFGWWVTNIPNEGVMANHNRAIHEYCHMVPGDFYITFDPDVRMQLRGWVSAMIEALQSDPNVVFCCAAMPHHDEKWCSDQHGRTIHSLPTGVRIAKYKALLAWSMGMWKGEWLAARPRDFKAAHPFYGWTEHADVDRMNAAGKKWLSLVDFYDHHLGADPIYVEWKVGCASGKIVVSFEKWLARRK